jgi:transcription factor SPN1
MKIDEIIRSKKSSRPRKKKSPTEVLDSFADDEVARLRETMNNAADEDMRANQDKLPALAKLRMLAEVVDTLRKASLAQSIIDNNLLDAVRRFLEPLPDRSLPALSIQRELFASLRKMEWIDSSALKESGLGRIVLFYTKCRRVERDVAKVAKELVESWSRPIVGRSKEYRDRVVPVVAGGVDASFAHSQGGPTGKLTLASILARAKEEESRPGARKVRKNAVSIPQRELGTYMVAPSDALGLAGGVAGSVRKSVEMDVERRRKNAERLRSLTRKVAAGSGAGGK